MASALKAALEDLLRAAACRPTRRRCAARTARLRAAAHGHRRRRRAPRRRLPARPGLRGPRPALRRGAPRLVLALARAARRAGARWRRWVDPGDRLDPGSAAAAGVDLARLLWLRGGVAGASTRALLPGGVRGGDARSAPGFSKSSCSTWRASRPRRAALAGHHLDPPAAADRGQPSGARAPGRRPRAARPGGGRRWP